MTSDEAQATITALLDTLDDLSDDTAVHAITQEIRETVVDLHPDKDVAADLAIYKQWYRDAELSVSHLQDTLRATIKERDALLERTQ